MAILAGSKTLVISCSFPWCLFMYLFISMLFTIMLYPILTMLDKLLVLDQLLVSHSFTWSHNLNTENRLFIYRLDSCLCLLVWNWSDWVKASNCVKRINSWNHSISPLLCWTRKIGHLVLIQPWVPTGDRDMVPEPQQPGFVIVEG